MTPIIVLTISFLLSTVNSQENCLTPSGENGICIILTSCDPLMDILKSSNKTNESSLTFLRDSHCGFIGKTPKVCCKSTVPLPSVQTTDETKINSIDNNNAPAISTITTSSPGVEEPAPNVSSHSNLGSLPHDICGPITQSKIIGGNRTGVLDWPWMALVAYDVVGKKEFRCGGTIITHNYIMTAAHCGTNLGSGLTLYGVRVGEHDLRTVRDCDRDKDGLEIVCAEGYQDFLVKSFIYHPDYESKTFKNDIGLIRVDGIIDFKPINVKPICLPIGTAARLNSKRVTVLGWGATDAGPRSEELLMVNLSPVSNEKCADGYGKKAAIWYKQICAGGMDGKDSCAGDSGGPMLAPAIYMNNARYIQYGIVSFGPRNCATEGIPGVYTRITYYMEWILDNITG